MSTSLNHSDRTALAIQFVKKQSSYLVITIGLAFGTISAHAATPLADQPLATSTSVPGNVALALSVEYPTAIRAAHTDPYAPATTFLGYFDPDKCYTYNYGATDDDRYFIPKSKADKHVCSGQWSGNFLNWATMQAIDPFRWALTGGYRKIDTPTLTVLERAWQSEQADNLSPDKTLSAALTAGATPFGSTAFSIRLAGLANKFRFVSAGASFNGVPIHFQNIANDSTVYEAFVRVKVCDSIGLESNCKQYGSNWKPEGLIQQYSEKIRFSAFGYLNLDWTNPSVNGNDRDGGVLRARQKFVGPKIPIPGQASIDNIEGHEWDLTTGVFLKNPDAKDAAQTSATVGEITIENSGVINYVNKFGEIYPGKYRSKDPVSELYYATLRYFRGIGNVPEWSSITGSIEAKKIITDGFPVIENWNDPIQYSCQKNSVLGIGDIYTHADKDVPGNENFRDEAYSKLPQKIKDDPWNAVTYTNAIGQLEGMGQLGLQTNINKSACCSNNSALMAGLAYYANTRDIRPDKPGEPITLGRQSVQTYWVDVLERNFEKNNQFYLAAKYGGLKIIDKLDALGDPIPYDLLTIPPESQWTTNSDLLAKGDKNREQKRPNNYFTAGSPDLLISGLIKAFEDIAAAAEANSSTATLPQPQVASGGNSSFSSKYSSSNGWTGVVAETKIGFGADGLPALENTPLWTTSDTLTAQLKGDGWNLARKVVTYDNTKKIGIPFRKASLPTDQLKDLDTAYKAEDDSADYLNYLRGDQTYETDSETPANRSYRARELLLGDIIGSGVTPVGPPNLPFSTSANPGYAEFLTQQAKRPMVVYASSNDGMLHAFNGSARPDAEKGDIGKELFAYIPGALYRGPSGKPGTDGLAALGNPSFIHHYYVNATPKSFDIDFSRTNLLALQNSPIPTPKWHTVLIGGLGKGGKSYYAIDITNPSEMTSEATVAGKVLWEFSHPDLGYTYGEAAVAKTAKYGWVVILPSGYNNSDGKGYFFILNPTNGELLEKVSTTSVDRALGSPANDLGMAHVNTYVNDRSDDTADAAYAGDLLGNIWRLDLTGQKDYTLKLLAHLERDGNPQPITSRPRIEIQRSTSKRFVLVGTGRLLEKSDTKNQNQQSFYVINDGLASPFSAATSAITRTDLINQPDVTQDLKDVATKKGWYIDFGQGADKTAWRVISNPAVFSGFVSFASYLPTGDVCKPDGQSNIYVVNFGSGKTALVNDKDGPLAYVEVAGSVVDLAFLSVNGEPKLIAGTSLNEVKSPKTNLTEPTALRRLNWRELRVVD